MIADLTTLPTNVQRWLKRCLLADAPLPKRIINTQEGEMDIRDRWTPFTAETVYDREPFSFLWKARINVLPGVWITAEDGHDGENGWGGSKLWNVISMGGREGAEVHSMQLVRHLAELPWIPQFALALMDLEWQDTGEADFEVQYHSGEHDITVAFELNEDGDIKHASSKRYYDVPDGFVEAPWHVAYSDWRDFEGVRIPTSASAAYDKTDGQWVYWRGRITSQRTEGS